MRNIWIIAKKEWRYFFTNPLGYIFAAVLLLVCNWLFLGDLFLIGQADMKPYWGVMIFLLSIFVPAIAMGSIADEKKNGTWEVLLTAPINETELVVGKILGGMMYLTLVIGLSAPITLTLLLLGRPDIGTIVGGYIGSLLLSWAYLSITVFMSSLTGQAIIAFLSSTVILLVNNLLGQSIISSKMPGFLGDLAINLSLGNRSAMFSSGLIEISSLLFFGSWIAIFTILSVLSLKTRDK
jgi:ABC-2 type transport system permease protein